MRSRKTRRKRPRLSLSRQIIAVRGHFHRKNYGEALEFLLRQHFSPAQLRSTGTGPPPGVARLFAASGRLASLLDGKKAR